MSKQRFVWIIGTLLILGLVGLSVPGSPIYLPELAAARVQYDGEPLSHWIEQLDHPDHDSCRQAIYAIGSMGTDAQEAIPKLAQIMLTHAGGQTRSEAALAISKMMPGAKLVVNQLGQAMDDTDAFVRMNAVMALFRLKEEASPAIPALLKALENQQNHTNLGAFSYSIYQMSILALGRASTGTDQCVGTFHQLLKSDIEDLTKVALIRALGDIGPPSLVAVTDIRPYLQSERADLRKCATNSLSRIEGLPKPTQTE
jgi:HEAT repeat protein